ncbi:MAG TPA: hypothetical protein VMG36_07715 [Thermoplasmata archaeon]|nr:hypothetical protein [Thermoplasmata archaeon]
MAWTVYSVATSKKAALDAALADDVVSRQSHTVRAAAALGGPADQTYVLVEGSADGVRRAEELLGPVGQKATGADGEALYRKFKDEQESASAGMGLFFTEDA